MPGINPLKSLAKPLAKPLAGCGVAALTLALWAVPAWAHVEPSPEEVAAGSTQTINFTIPHGCDGSPTTGIKIQLPIGVSAAQPVDLAGWTAAASATEVSWTGGSIPDDATQDFGIRMTFPTAAGRLAFPAIQTCEQGETRWIEESVEGQEEPEHPAPVVTVTAADSGTGGGTVSSDVPGTTEMDHDSADHDSTTTTSDDEKVTATPIKAADADDDDGSATGWIIGGIAAAVVVIGALGVALRKKGEPGTDKDEPEVES